MNCHRASLLLLALLATTPTLLSAQATSSGQPRRPSAASVARAFAGITEAEFREKLGALADDSTRGREAPSPELTKATTWVAERFQAAGLKGAGDAGSFMQHFELRHTRAQSMTVRVSGPGFGEEWLVGRELLLAGSRPADRRDLPLVLVTGVSPDTAHPFGDQPVNGAAVLVVVRPEELSGAVLNPMAAHADAAGVAVFAAAAEMPSARWTQLSARQSSMERWLLPDVAPAERHPTMFQLQYDAAARLLRALGEDPPALLAPGRYQARVVPGVTVSVALADTVLERATVANVVGMIEGSDPVLRHEVVLFTSHLDHVGVIGGGRCNASRELPADSICNGADDNASGTVGLIELAQAYAQLSPRPARTLVFAACTAEERGLLGSYFHASRPVVPLDHTAAVINLDMIARSQPDTIYSVGHHYSTLGMVLDDVARAHPELRLSVVNEPDWYAQSDHFPFAEQGVPALFFNSGRHPDLHTAADNVDRANTGQAARILRLVFLTGLEVADTRERPAWDAAAREKVVVRRPAGRNQR